MTRQWWLLLSLLVANGLLLMSFTVQAAPPGQAGGTVVPTAASSPSATSTVTATVAATTTVEATPTSQPTSSAANVATGRIDVSSLIPEGPGKELVLQYCVNCHNIAPIALAAHSPDQWDAQRIDHGGFVMADKETIDKIYEYMKKYYPEGREIPELPPELLTDWTSY